MTPPASTGEPDDLHLVEAARSGDRAAMDALLRRHYDRIAKLCRRLVNQPDDAADCTQEALIAVVRGLAGFDGRAAFSTWSHRVDDQRVPRSSPPDEAADR